VSITERSTWLKFFQGVSTSFLNSKLNPLAFSRINDKSAA